jgi:hypothetical protein
MYHRDENGDRTFDEPEYDRIGAPPPQLDTQCTWCGAPAIKATGSMCLRCTANGQARAEEGAPVAQMPEAPTVKVTHMTDAEMLDRWEHGADTNEHRQALRAAGGRK